MGATDSGGLADETTSRPRRRYLGLIALWQLLAVAAAVYLLSISFFVTLASHSENGEPRLATAWRSRDSRTYSTAVLKGLRKGWGSNRSLTGSVGSAPYARGKWQRGGHVASSLPHAGWGWRDIQRTAATPQPAEARPP